jgi:hypothetical protein
MKRVIEIVGSNNAVLKTLVRKKAAQQFVFDGKTKTIQSLQWKGKSFNI